MEQSLSKEEVEANYTRILGGTEGGLVLYWPLDEGLGVKAMPSTWPVRTASTS